MKILKEIQSFSVAMTQNDQFIFLFGRMRAGGGFHGDIFVIDPNAMTIKESLIKCPVIWWSFRSIVMNASNNKN